MKLETISAHLDYILVYVSVTVTSSSTGIHKPYKGWYMYRTRYVVNCTYEIVKYLAAVIKYRDRISSNIGMNMY